MPFDHDLFIQALRAAAGSIDEAITMLEGAEDSGMTEYARGYTLAQLDSAATTIEMQLPEFIAGSELLLREQLEKLTGPVDVDELKKTAGED